MPKSVQSAFVCLAASVLLSGCVTAEQRITREEPDPRFDGVIATGEIRGERSVQVLGAIEARLLQAFPKAQWLKGRVGEADVLLDVTVYSARVNDTRSTQEQRICRRWSEPDKDAKGALQRLVSRNCLDWQVQQIACLTRKYELDVQLRARLRNNDRLIVSDRKVSTSSDRSCGNDSPALAGLQASAETEVAAWVAGLLRPPLAELASNQARVLVSSNPPTVAAAPVPATAAQPVSPTSTPPISVTPAPAVQQALLPAKPTGVAIQPIEAHALVIGNANYPGSARLVNPINDAQAMERKLSELGFKVTRIDDGDRDALVRGLNQFHQRAAASQVTVLYYSGHGMQLDGTNYLMPVNIDITKPGTLKLQAIPLDTIIDTYLPGRTRVVFLDACRDNPAATASARGFSRGLAPMQVPTGTLIAYATRDGGVAEDGSGRHSPFTQALLDLIAEPEDISLILRKVRDRVMRETVGRQQPWEYGSLSGGELIFSRLRNR